ncbi:MAG: hypothetical protein ABFR97_05215 [Thermodesulfobacteriota bacterium]
MYDELTKELKEIQEECSSLAQKAMGGVRIFESLFLEHVKVLAGDSCDKQKRLIVAANAIEERCGSTVRVAFYRAVVCQLYNDNVVKINEQKLPREIEVFVREDFARAAKIAKEGKEKVLDPGNYIFFSYLEILTFQRIPLGNHSAVVAGFSRSLVFAQPVGGMAKFLRVLFACKGNAPFYELHYNPHRMRLFSPKGWRDVLANSAQMLAAQPNIKGVFGATWLFDPALGDVSPELSYLREQIVLVGGEIFFGGRHRRDRRNAFAMSKVRKVAYDEGRYDPASYMAIIPRLALLNHFECE